MQPHTPKKHTAINSFSSSSTKSFTRDTKVEQSFQDFSNKYKLRLRIPDAAVLQQSPQKQRRLASEGREDRDETLFRRYTVHYHMKNLPSILEMYHERATTLCQKWAQKPHGEGTVTSGLTNTPEARNPTEREELKRLLYQILQKHQPAIGGSTPYSSKTLRSGREISALSDLSSSNTGSTTRPSPAKRGSDDSFETVIKRSKNIVAGRTVAERSLGSSESGRLHHDSFYGHSSEDRRESVVFSDQQCQVSQGSQTTVEASSQERARWPSAPSRFIRNEKSAPSSSLRVLTGSSVKSDSKSAMHDNVRQFLDSSSPTHTYSDFGNLLPDHGLAALEDSFAEPDLDPSQNGSFALHELSARLHASWPRTPLGLANAPFPIVWEVLRILLHCEIATHTFDLEYEESWNDQNRFWRILQADTALSGKAFPEKSSPTAWDAAMSGFRVQKQAVVLAVKLTPSTTSTGPFFQVQLHPLEIERTHRLARRFGFDRFMEVIVPSIDHQNVAVLTNVSGEAITCIRRWISSNLHPFCGRFWKPFFVRAIREGPAKSSTRKNDHFEPEPKQVMKHRFYLFAQDGDDFQTPLLSQRYPLKNEDIAGHTKMSVTGLIEWLLQPKKNGDQPSLKLFSRISLGLSRTEPTVVLEKGQFRHIDQDICSPDNEIMNDGIGRISHVLARKIRDSMGLTETPAGFQGRIGSAKGFWVLDVSDRSDDIWLETYPSQRKWTCDFEDEDQRTFEVTSCPNLPVSASLNKQFLPILMEQAPTKRNKDALKKYLGGLLVRLLKNEVEVQRVAMQDPLSCSAWVDKSSSLRKLARLQDDQIPRLGSLPRHVEDRIQFLLAAGFDPLKQRFLWEMVWKLCKDRCEELKSRINIKVGQSMYAYMVIDFEGVLEEDEVHVSFSSNFKDELSGFSNTHLHGVDVLVARSPAHFPSDIQKVKAVFKPELGALKDVIVFSRKGKVPLAGKLSGGDYDGDKAWVCWDADIVTNFKSAMVPEEPDLFQEGIISKRTGNYQDLMNQHEDKAISKFLEGGFDFNMQPTFLGMCTVFKENLCYKRKSVSDSISTRLSTMLSRLVDQEKQGIVFKAKDFSAFKRSCLGRKEPEPAQPKYKENAWTAKGAPSHIIDYLKFIVIIPTVNAELERLDRDTEGKKAEVWDEDLAFYYNYYNDLRVKNPGIRSGMVTLQDDLQRFHRELETLRAMPDLTFGAKVEQCHEKFQLIQPGGFEDPLCGIITLCHSEGRQHSHWNLLRASTYYKNYYNRSDFFWWIVGSELQEIKARASRGGPIVTLNAMTYAAMRLDPKYVRARNTRRAGLGDTIRDDEEQWDECE